MRWSTGIGIVLLLLVGLVAYAVIAPPLRHGHKIERAVRAQHPELTHVSCRQLNPLDATIYTCSGRDGPVTSCIRVTGNLDHPVVEVGSHWQPGDRPNC